MMLATVMCMNVTVTACHAMENVYAGGNVAGVQQQAEADFARAMATLEQRVSTAPADERLDAWLKLAQEASVHVVTSATPQFAELLAFLGNLNVELRLFHDAAVCYESAYQLTSNNTYRADVLWARARAAQENGELNVMAEKALAALMADPYAHPECYHMLALEACQRDGRSQARKLWLRGLHACGMAGSGDDVLGFLDNVLPYLKWMNETDMQRVYDALAFIAAVRGTDVPPLVLARLLQERVKLRYLFPSLQAGVAWTDLLASVCGMSAGATPPPCASSCASATATEVLRSIRDLRYVPRLHAAARKHAAGNYEGAAHDYHEFIMRGTNDWMTVVDGCTARFLALGRLARLSTRLAGAPAALQTWVNDAIALYAQGKAGANATPVLAQCLVIDAVLAGLQGNEERAHARFEWACTVAPSSFFPRVYLAAYNAGESVRRGALEDARRYLDEARALERARPALNLVQLAERIEDGRPLPADTEELAQRDRERLLLWMRGLDEVIMDLSPSGDKPGIVRPRRLREVPYLPQVCACVMRDVWVDVPTLKHFHDWLGRFGATIPAVPEYATLIRETKHVRGEMAAILERTNALEVLIVLTAYGDAVPAQLYCVSDGQPACALMEMNTDGAYETRVTVAPGLPRVRFRFCAHPDERLEERPEQLRASPLLREVAATPLQLYVTNGFWRWFDLTLECGLLTGTNPGTLVAESVVTWPETDGSRRAVLYDDGTHGDAVAGDRICSRTVRFEHVPAELRYMYAEIDDHSGERRPEKVRPFERRIGLASATTNAITVRDIFGTILE